MKPLLACSTVTYTVAISFTFAYRVFQTAVNKRWMRSNVLLDVQKFALQVEGIPTEMTCQEIEVCLEGLVESLGNDPSVDVGVSIALSGPFNYYDSLVEAAQKILLTTERTPEVAVPRPCRLFVFFRGADGIFGVGPQADLTKAGQSMDEIHARTHAKHEVILGGRDQLLPECCRPDRD